MKIIVPMAGRGSRLRPHTLTVPKPLVPVGGKPIVHRLVEDIAKTLPEKIDEIAFVIGDFGKEVESELIAVAEKLGAKGSIFYQHQALGTAHAVMCAEPCLTGPVVVAFADTLFRADFTLDKTADGILWVSQIEDPSAFGVVTLDKDGNIDNFVEKSKTFVSDLAMIGIYYFKDGDKLKHELKYLIDNNIMNGGEYQLPDALKNLTKKGSKFKPGKVTEWLDCGNKEVTVYTNQRVLEFDRNEKLIADNVTLNNSIIIPPCYVGSGVVLENSVVGPHVSIGEGSKISNSVISNSIIQKKSVIKNSNLKNSMIGSHVILNGKVSDVSLGDYTVMD